MKHAIMTARHLDRVNFSARSAAGSAAGINIASPRPTDCGAGRPDNVYLLDISAPHGIFSMFKNWQTARNLQVVFLVESVREISFRSAKRSRTIHLGLP